MRVYIPATWSDLATDLLNPSALYAVTDELTASFDDEELAELYAFQRASEQSVTLVDASDSRPRRVVIAVEINAVGNALGDDPACFAADGPIMWSDAVSIHVDDVDRDIAGALASEEALAELTREPLAWFDVTERDALTD